MLWLINAMTIYPSIRPFINLFIYVFIHTLQKNKGSDVADYYDDQESDIEEDDPNIPKISIFFS